MATSGTGTLAAHIGGALADVNPPGTLHVAAWCRDDPADRLLSDARTAVPAASTIKVPILFAALREAAAGRLDLANPVTLPQPRVGGSGVLQTLPGVRTLTLTDLLTLMIVVSDNTATNCVIDLIGMDAVNACSADLGLTATVLRRLMMDTVARERGLENTTSALDQASCLQSLAWQRVLPDELRKFALHTLRQQQFNHGLPSLLPDGVVLAHKTGELPGVRHDVGILTGTDNRHAIVAVLVSGLDGPRAQFAAGSAIAAIGAAAWRALTG